MPTPKKTGWLGGMALPSSGRGVLPEFKVSKALAMLLFSVASCPAAVNPEVSESSGTAGALADKEDTGEGARGFW